MTVAPEAPTAARGDDLLPAEQLARYADAVVLGSIRLNAGDMLMIRCQPAHREFAVALAAAGYRAGARLVEVRYDDPRVTAARVRYARDEALGAVADWEVKRANSLISQTAASVSILGEADPGVFDGLPLDRLNVDATRPITRLKRVIAASKAGKTRWAGAAWPTVPWATRVYPELEPLDAQRRLAHDLLWFCRLGPDAPPGFEGWQRHVEAVAARSKTLTDLTLERLELRGPGTALDLRLAPATVWAGGQEPNAYGQVVAPNIPTEETFTSPDASGTEGTFRCSRPLSFRGRVIDGIAGELRRGRLVRLEAATDDDREFLAAHLDSVPNGRRLGEVALVDATSRIGQTGKTYANTLIDENAVAHIAFGAGFPSITRKKDPAARGPRGVNRSNLHLDVMIGTDDLEATGVARGGDRVPLIRDGLWQI